MQFISSVAWCKENRKLISSSHGAQGVLDAASNGSLESEFGTYNEDEVVKQILEKGELQQTVVSIDWCPCSMQGKQMLMFDHRAANARVTRTPLMVPPCLTKPVMGLDSGSCLA